MPIPIQYLCKSEVTYKLLLLRTRVFNTISKQIVRTAGYQGYLQVLGTVNRDTHILLIQTCACLCTIISLQAVRLAAIRKKITGLGMSIQSRVGHDTKRESNSTSSRPKTPPIYTYHPRTPHDHSHQASKNNEIKKSGVSFSDVTCEPLPSGSSCTQWSNSAHALLLLYRSRLPRSADVLKKQTRMCSLLVGNMITCR